MHENPLLSRSDSSADITIGLRLVFSVELTISLVCRTLSSFLLPRIPLKSGILNRLDFLGLLLPSFLSVFPSCLSALSLLPFPVEEELFDPCLSLLDDLALDLDLSLLSFCLFLSFSLASLLDRRCSRLLVDLGVEVRVSDLSLGISSASLSLKLTCWKGT